MLIRMSTTRRGFFVQSAVAASQLAGATSLLANNAKDDFEPLFDGRSLAGWHAAPRISPLRGEVTSSAALDEFLTAQRRHKGLWRVRDGAIEGGQAGPRTINPATGEEWGFGGWLMSDRVFGDFELRVDAKPDWPCDTGIYVRATEAGEGFQVLLDHRGDDQKGVGGGIGCLYLKGIGNFRVDPHNYRWSVGADGLPNGVRLIAGTDGVTRTEYSVTSDDFASAWRMNDWNTFRVRVVGQLPRITTWINDVKICECDTQAIRAPNYDPEAVASRLGPAGHIAFEVHDGPANRWGVGKVCRWRNIMIRDL